MTSFYTSCEASAAAELWCNKRPTWIRICDMKDTTHYYKGWSEISTEEQSPWIRNYKGCAQEAWEEFGHKTCKIKFGFISGKGDFFNNIEDVPFEHNMMMVFQVGKEEKSRLLSKSKRKTKGSVLSF